MLQCYVMYNGQFSHAEHSPSFRYLTQRRQPVYVVRNRIGRSLCSCVCGLSLFLSFSLFLSLSLSLSLSFFLSKHSLNRENHSDVLTAAPGQLRWQAGGTEGDCSEQLQQRSKVAAAGCLTGEGKVGDGDIELQEMAISNRYNPESLLQTTRPAPRARAAPSGGRASKHKCKQTKCRTRRPSLRRATLAPLSAGVDAD